MKVQRMVIETLARDLDPTGGQERKAHPPEEKNLPEHWPKSLLVLRWSYHMGFRYMAA